ALPNGAGAGVRTLSAPVWRPPSRAPPPPRSDGEAELGGGGGVKGRDRPALLRHPSRLALVLAPAHRELAVAGFAPAARLSEAADELSIRLDADQPVAEGGGDLHALRTARRHHERRR